MDRSCCSGAVHIQLTHRAPIDEVAKLVLDLNFCPDPSAVHRDGQIYTYELGNLARRFHGRELLPLEIELPFVASHDVYEDFGHPAHSPTLSSGPYLRRSKYGCGSRLRFYAKLPSVSLGMQAGAAARTTNGSGKQRSSRSLLVGNVRLSLAGSST